MSIIFCTRSGLLCESTDVRESEFMHKVAESQGALTCIGNEAYKSRMTMRPIKHVVLISALLAIVKSRREGM